MLRTAMLNPWFLCLGWPPLPSLSLLAATPNCLLLKEGGLLRLLDWAKNSLESARILGGPSQMLVLSRLPI